MKTITKTPSATIDVPTSAANRRPFISEIFPNEVRSYGNAFGSSTHWVFAALISAFFPFFAGKFGGGFIFASFAFLMFLQLIWVWKVMPETKGISLESIEKKLD